MIRAIVLDAQDNVATMMGDGKAGDTVQLTGPIAEIATLRQDIAFGHKLAIRPISQGQAVMKYGQVIGRATESIEVGQHVHVHNVESLRGRGDLAAQR